MMKALLLLILFSTQIFAATKPEGCGVFDIYGTVRENKGKATYDIVVNEGSVSEYRFHLAPLQERQVIMYSDQSVKVTAIIAKAIKTYEGSLQEIIKADLTTPDPANFNGKGGFTLVKKEKCK